MSVRLSASERLGRAVAALAVSTSVLLTAAPAAAGGTAAADTGYVRLAHLSPDTPAVDVYLRSQSGDVAERTFPGVAYGAFSDYLRLPTGLYAVAMRTAGAPADAAPVLTTQVSVDAGGAFTVAGVGRYADLGLRVLRDDLSLPAAGRSKIRIVQASVRAPVLDVDVAGGAAIGSGVAFATTTGYREVAPGTWKLQVQPSGGGEAVTLPCELGAGSVYSVLILDRPGGGLQARLIADAGRRGVVPAGGVAAGAGGHAAPNHSAALLLAMAAAVLTGTVTAALRRRPRRR